jgi:phage terminase large subunit GpA-like protein
MIVMPTENDTKKRFRTRIRPMFEAMPSLRRHLPKGRLEYLNIGQETELDNMFLYLAWSGSPAAMADTPIKKLILDEVAKFPSGVGREAGAIDLLRIRLTTYAGSSKLYGLSTPVLAGDSFSMEMQNTDQRKFWVRCQFCRQYHVQRWEYAELDKDSAGNLLSPRDYNSGQCARYICPNCEKKWDEFARWQAVCEGKWAPRDCSVDENGIIKGKVFSNPNRGYYISGLILYPGFMTIAAMAAEWAKADRAWKAGNPKPKQNFFNSKMGEDWEEKEKKTELDSLKIHIGQYSADTIPAGVQMITAGADIQIDHIWAAIIGWGYMSEAWSIFETRLETGDTQELGNYELLRMLLAKTWPLPGMSNYQISIVAAGVDCNYRPDTVKDFCQLVTETTIYPVRGDDTVWTKMFRAVKIERTNLYR